MTSSTRPLLVLDSASLYYRAFYALPEKMTAPDGRPHNAVRGFLSTVSRLVQTVRPGALVAAWDDDWRPQWRVDLVPSYKAHRVAEGGAGGEAEPESLGAQAAAIAEILEALGVARWGVPGFEADDVIGSVTAQADGPCLVVTGDRDLVQLIDDRTHVLLTVNGGMDTWPELGPTQALERFGVPADRYADVAALRGDPSDGLPGVPGIGAKTAVALVEAFGSLDGVLAAAGSEPPIRPMTPRLAASLAAHADAVTRAALITRVRRDLALPGPVPTALPRVAEPERLADVAARWGVTRQVDDLQTAVAQTDAA